MWCYLTNHPNIITWLLVVLGWVVVHLLSRRRDLKNKKREMKISYLVGTYRQLKGSFVSGDKQAFIHAVDDIQLFGSKTTITLLKRNLHSYIDDNTGKYFPRETLKSLRNDLRKELKIELTDEDFIFLREDINVIRKVRDFDDVTQSLQNRPCLFSCRKKP